MEWLAQCLDKIIQSRVLEFAAAHFYWVDWLTVGFTFVGLIYGIQRGLLRTLVVTAELVFIAFVTFVCRPQASNQVHIYLPFVSAKFLPAAGFVVIALPLSILVMLLDGKLIKLFHTSLTGPIRILGGAVVGVFFGLFLWSFLCQPILLTPIPKMQKNFEPGISWSGAFMKGFSPSIYKKAKEKKKEKTKETT